MSTPLVPPRPTRTTASAGPTAVKEPMPHVPPRPTRKQDPSPARDDYTRSPLNELPDPYGRPLSRKTSRTLAPTDLPPRPPSVSLPSVGQEGSEYASYDQLPPEAHGVSIDSKLTAPQQTRNVSASMPLHAPKASIPQSTATSRIGTVTGTDSTQAAAAGIGRAQPEDDVHRIPEGTAPPPLGRVPSRTDYHARRVSSTEPHPLDQRAHANKSSSSLPGKAASVHEIGLEYGIPEIGRQIPLNPNAGDAQAPSVVPTLAQHMPGIGFFNDGSARAHQRRRSSRQQFGPPDSYGLHGHGVESQDRFERDWVAKHPREAAMEGYSAYGHYHVPRPASALSTEALNKLVTQTSDAGLGASLFAVGGPSWEIANQATEEYTSRFSSPKLTPTLTSDRKKRGSNGSQPAVDESPHRRSASAAAALSGFDREAVILQDDGTIHLDPLERRTSHITGGGAADGALDLGPRSGNTVERGGWYDERGDGTPILASDETLKRPGSAYMLAAISPEMKFSGYEYYDGSDHEHESRRSSLHVSSRPSSRPGSVHGGYHGGHLHRFISHDEHYASGVHTPLEEIEEYEPLFPDDETVSKAKPKPKTLRRPGLEHHHFPSQDIWEDTPMSLQYQTTVETPDLPHEEQVAQEALSSTKTFETPEQEQNRRSANSDDMQSEAKMVNKPHFKSSAYEIHRPGMQRFPSQDIWEDTPDSMRLVTTVSGPQTDDLKGPMDEEKEEEEEDTPTRGVPQVPIRPSIPARPARKSRLAEEVKPENIETLEPPEPDDRDSPAPIVTEKQASPTKAAAPVIPDRPKPHVPARPTKSVPAATATASEASVADAVASKPKPAVPTRPGGEKIAALKAGFMNDLNQRLKLGPQGSPAAKATEVETDAPESDTVKVPLADARKSRAKGPPRRKPASSAVASADSKVGDSFGFASMVTVWHIDESELLHVPGQDTDSTEHTGNQDLSASADSEQMDGTTELSTLDRTASQAQVDAMSTPEVERKLQDALESNEAANTTEAALRQPGSPPPDANEADANAAPETIDNLLGSSAVNGAESELSSAKVEPSGAQEAAGEDGPPVSSTDVKVPAAEVMGSQDLEAEASHPEQGEQGKEAAQA